MTKGHGGATLGPTLRQATAHTLNGISDAAMSFRNDPLAATAGGFNGVLEATAYPLLDALWYGEELLYNRSARGEWRAE